MKVLGPMLKNGGYGGIANNTYTEDNRGIAGSISPGGHSFVDVVWSCGPD